jgi:hypothetical protein
MRPKTRSRARQSRISTLKRAALECQMIIASLTTTHHRAGSNLGQLKGFDLVKTDR